MESRIQWIQPIPSGENKTTLQDSSVDAVALDRAARFSVMESIPTRFEALVPTAGYIASGISKFLPASVTLEPAWEAFVSACDSLGALTAPWASASTVLRVPALESAVNDFAASVGASHWQ